MKHLDIGRALRDQRKRQGLKQITVAMFAGVSPAYLCRVEKSGRDFQWSTIERIARAMGLQIKVAFSKVRK